MQVSLPSTQQQLSGGGTVAEFAKMLAILLAAAAFVVLIRTVVRISTKQHELMEQQQIEAELAADRERQQAIDAARTQQSTRHGSLTSTTSRLYQTFTHWK
jgi:hypothetical protein